MPTLRQKQINVIANAMHAAWHVNDRKAYPMKAQARSKINHMSSGMIHAYMDRVNKSVERIRADAGALPNP